MPLPRLKNIGEFSFATGLIALAAWGLWLLSDLRFGTAMRMGPGYMPTMLCWIGIGLGAVLALRSLVVAAPPPSAWTWRPLLAISAAVGAFMLVEKIGLVAGVVLVVLVASLGDRETRWAHSILFAAGLAGFAALVFVVGLGLSMPLFPPVFGR